MLTNATVVVVRDSIVSCVGRVSSRALHIQCRIWGDTLPDLRSGSRLRLCWLRLVC